MLAERMDILHAQCLGGAIEEIELVAVAVEDRVAAGNKPFEDLGLGRGDLLDALEIAEMGSRDRRDDRTCGCTILTSGLISRDGSSDFEYAEVRILRHPRQRQGNAPVIVEGRDGRMHLARWREHVTQHLLGGGLADRPRHRDDLRLGARTRRHAELGQGREHILDNDHRNVNRPMAGSLDSLTTSSAAPLAIAMLA